MAGSISLSMTQQLDEFGAPLAGGHLYFYQAGTVSTPQNAFQDSALTLPWPNPFILDASGRIDQLFFADGSIKIRLTDVNGVEKLVKDGLLVVGASSGGGGGSPVDATTILATGDIKVRYGTGVLSGFVRLNARTIGSATSGASERANADTQALFEYLWNNDATLTVSTGRGASSIADWSANKTIALPDCRGRVLAALNDMGNTNAGIVVPTAAAIQKGDTITLGSLIGLSTSRTLATANVPAHTHSGTTGVESATHVHTTGSIAITTGGAGPALAAGGSGVNTGVNTTSHTHSFTTDNGTGTATPFDTISAMMLITVYCKL